MKTLLTQGVEVECAPEGEPQTVRTDMDTWEIVPGTSPTLWYVRRAWWAEDFRVAVGTGLGAVDDELWRIQARPLRDRTAVPVTLDLAHSLRSGRWRLLQVHQGDQLSYEALDASVVDF